MARNSKIPPEPALPRPEEKGQEHAWLNNLTIRLYNLFRLMIDQVNLLLDGYVVTVSALPTASVTHRGRIVSVPGGAGVADHVYICQKNAADAYVWTLIV